MKKYQICLVQMMNGYIGNSIVDFALYSVLQDNGYSVLMVNALSKSTECGIWKDIFISQPYELDDVLEPSGLGDCLYGLNDCCEMFLLGSDQVLRACFVRESNFLNCFYGVSTTKYKAAYAASFGSDTYEDEKSRTKIGFFLHRFQRISVREKSGVNLLKRQFGLDGDWVLDPTFLCDIDHYKRMAQKGRSRLPKEKYVAAYLLDMTEFGEHVIKAVEKKRGIKEHLAILESQIRKDRGYFGGMNTMPRAKIEEWLALIQNSEFVITDSFHGLCFSLIFGKNFLVIFDKECWRGNTRFESLLSLLHLKDRIIYSIGDVARALELPDIDYSVVNTVLKREKDRSKKWLIDTVHQGLRFEGQSVQEAELVPWGAGDCFARNYDKIRQMYPIRYVCDSNPSKWGTYPMEGVLCISSERLKALGNVFVLITVDHPGASLQIANLLLDMGIRKMDHIENWIE